MAGSSGARCGLATAIVRRGPALGHPRQPQGSPTPPHGKERPLKASIRKSRKVQPSENPSHRRVKKPECPRPSSPRPSSPRPSSECPRPSCAHRQGRAAEHHRGRVGCSHGGVLWLAQPPRREPQADAEKLRKSLFPIKSIPPAAPPS